MELVNEFTVNADVATTWATLTDVERIAPCMPGAQLTEIEGEVFRGTVAVKVGPITAKFKGEASFVEQDAAARKAVLKAAGRDTGGKGNASALITAQLSEVSPTSTHVLVTTDLTITGKVAQFGRGALADVSTKLIGQFVEQLETTVLAGDGAATAAPATGASAAPVGDTASALTSDPAAAPVEAEAAPAADTTPTPAAASPASAPASTPAAASATAPSASVGAAEADTPAAPKVRKIDGPEAQPINLVDAAGGAMAKRLLPVGLIAVLLLIFWRRRGRSAD
jgi:carbon monoxide dehydrogenase subunit G